MVWVIEFEFSTEEVNHVYKVVDVSITSGSSFCQFENYVFAFLDDHHFPPDNNASERAIRNFKVKLKVSNFFKSTAGSDGYAIIRSVIDTAIKNNQNPYEATRLIAILPTTD